MPLIATRTHGRPTTDHPTPPPAPHDRGRSWLARLFGGDFAFPAVAPAPLACARRDPVEHDAVARALGCRDLFVIDAADRHARERVIAELIRAAAARGERVLAISPDPAAADRLAEAVVADQSTRVVRALAAEENPYRPLPGATRLTSIAAGQGRVEQLRREAAAAVATAEHALAPLAAAARIADELRTLAERFTTAGQDRAALIARRDTLDAEVRGQADCTPAFTALRTAHETETAPLAARHDEAAKMLKEKEAALATARQHHIEALADVGKKSGFFARLLGKPKHHGDPAVLEQEIHNFERDVKDFADREAKFRSDLDAAAAGFAALRERHIADEVAARRADLEAELVALGDERDGAVNRFAVRGKDLEAAGFAAPGQLSTEAVERVAAEIAERKREPDRRLAEARDRLAELNRTGPELTRRFLAEARAVVATPASLHADPVFEAPADPAASPFGLLILDHAEELTDHDFLGLSRLAERWVLTGDASLPDVAPPTTNGAGRPSRNGRPPEPTFVARLARLLDREPWAAEGDRFVCRLVHLTPEQRRTAAREAVLDRPDIELRLTTDETGQVVLAEIAFPAHTPVAEAKEFLLRHLDEVLLRPCGERQWHQSADSLTACWPAAETNAACAWVDLEPGVREKVVGVGPAAFTAAVAFDTSAGWDIDKAEDWLTAHIPAATPGRLAVLPRGTGHALHPPRPVAVV